MRHRHILLVATIATALLLTGCLNSITLDAADLGEDSEAAEISGPETVVSAAGSSGAAEIETVVDGSGDGSDGSGVEAPYMEDGAGGKIEGFALDEFEIADAVEEGVNEYRTDESSTMMGRQPLEDSGSLSVAAREQSRRMSRNVIRLYSREAGDTSSALDGLSGANEENREMRFARHNAAECNEEISSLDRKHESINVTTAQITVSGENVTAIGYGELGDRLGGSNEVSDEKRIASAIVDTLQADPGVRENMVRGGYRYQGVGVKNVPSEGVMVVVQDYC